MPEDPRWKLLGSERRFDDKLISVHHDLYRSDESGPVQEFTVIRTSDWVNVIPLTPDGRIVFIRQFRHGVRETTLEIPGGAIDPTDADPLAAAKRELREETGLEATEWRHIGCVTPNPAIQANRCHTFLATGVLSAGPQRLDPSEAIEVLTLAPAEAASALRNGTIHHALVLAAFAFYWLAGNELR